MLFPIIDTSHSTPCIAYAVPAASLPPAVDILKSLLEIIKFLLYPMLIP